MTVLLIHPPQKWGFNEFLYLPTGFQIIGWYLSKHNIDCRIIWPLYQHELKKWLKIFNPELVAISLHWSVHSYGAIECAKVCKKFEFPVVIGGHTATYFCNEILEKFPYIDGILVGDSEEPLRSLLHRKLYRNVFLSPDGHLRDYTKIAEFYRTSSAVLSSFSLEEFLDFHPYLKRKYKKENKIFIITGKGCKHNCPHCGGSKRFYQSYFGYNFIQRDIKSILKDVYFAQEYFPTNYIFMTHDLFALYSKNKISKFVENVPNDMLVEYELFSLPEDIKTFKDFINKCRENSILSISPETNSDYLRKKLYRDKFFSNHDLIKFLQKISPLLADKIVHIYFIKNFNETNDYLINKLIMLSKELSLRIGIISMNISIDPGSDFFVNHQKYGIQLRLKSFKDFYEQYSRVSDDKYRFIGFHFEKYME